MLKEYDTYCIDQFSIEKNVSAMIQTVEMIKNNLVGVERFDEALTLKIIICNNYLDAPREDDRYR